MQRGSVLPLLLIVVFVVGIGIAGFFFLKNSSQPQAPEPVQVASTNQVNPSSNPSTATVSDDLLGLSFAVPAGLKVVKETEEEYFKRANGNIRKNFNGYIFYFPADFVESFYILSESEDNPDKALLTVWVFQNPDSLDAIKFYEKYWYYPFVWGDFTSRKHEIEPKDIELIDSKEGRFGIVDYRDGKPKFIYLPLRDKNLMLQIQYPDGNATAKEILNSFKFE